MRAAFERQRGWPRGNNERWQNRLEHKSRAARGADVEAITTRRDSGRLEYQLARCERCAFHPCLPDFRSGVDCCEMLSEQARLPAGSANVSNTKRLTGDER